MNPRLEKSGIKKLKDQFLSRFLEDAKGARFEVEGINKDCQNTFSYRPLEMVRRQLDTSSKRIVFELNNLIVLLENLNDENVETMNDIDEVLSKNS